MATIVTAGTEILRAHHFRLPSAVGPHVLIYGEQHHIYTVLSIICHCSYDPVANQNDGLTVGITSYDAIGGGNASGDTFIFVHKDSEISGRDTFVWNDNLYSTDRADDYQLDESDTDKYVLDTTSNQSTAAASITIAP